MTSRRWGTRWPPWAWTPPPFVHRALPKIRQTSRAWLESTLDCLSSSSPLPLHKSDSMSKIPNLMTLSKKSTDTRYIILLPVLPLHKLDTDIFQKIYLYPIYHPTPRVAFAQIGY